MFKVSSLDQPWYLCVIASFDHHCVHICNFSVDLKLGPMATIQRPKILGKKWIWVNSCAAVGEKLAILRCILNWSIVRVQLPKYQSSCCLS